MFWSDEGYLLSKNTFDENSIIVEVFTFQHGKYSGIVYGGSSRKQKKNFQIGNKLFINWKSKNENRTGYFNIELIKPISPFFFDDKKRAITILSASSFLKILLPERQINKKIYNSYENFINNLSSEYWLKDYLFWELSLIKELGFEIDFNKDSSKDTIEFNGKLYKVPNLFKLDNSNKATNNHYKEALEFNKNLLVENFITPNKLRIPLSRNILEKYFY